MPICPENSEWDRTLTDYLYGGDPHYRLCQEVVLGIGGVRMLRALGYDAISRFHMNEGHASLLTLELLEEEARKAGRTTVTAARTSRPCGSGASSPPIRRSLPDTTSSRSNMVIQRAGAAS